MSVRNIIAAVALLLPTLIYADWTGGVKKPSTIEKEGKTFYEIESAENLAWLATQVNKGNPNYNAILKNDVAITSSKVSSETIKWISIGTDSTTFNGVFDGSGYKVSGFYSQGKYAGLFGFIGEGAVVKNLKLDNALAQGDNGIAGILAASFGGDSIIDVQVSGTVLADSLAGGLAGQLTGRNFIVHSRSNAKIGSKYYAGGFVGSVKGSVHFYRTVGDCALDSATNTGAVGGFVGYVENKAFFFNDTNVANIIYGAKQSSSAIGGFVGNSKSISTTQFEECVNKGNLYGSKKNNMGGFIGNSNGHVNIFTAVNEGKIENGNTCGGFIGNFNASHAIIRDVVNRGYMDNTASGGIIGTSGNKGSFIDISNARNNAVLHGNSAAGIVYSFQGDTLLISKCVNADSLYATSYNGTSGGILGFGRGSSNNGRVGYDAYIVIENCTNEGSISGSGAMGGIVGSIDDDKIIPNTYVKNSKNFANISGVYTYGFNGFGVGGIAGYAERAYIQDCINYGKVSADLKGMSDQSYFVGGVAGYAGNVFYSMNEGGVSVHSDSSNYSMSQVVAAGIAGYADSVEYCKNHADVNFEGQTLGKETIRAYAAGVVGFAENLVRYCENEGRVYLDMGEKTYSANAAGVHAGRHGSYSDRPRLGANINKGRVLMNSNSKYIVNDHRNSGAWSAYSYTGDIRDIESGTLSITDSVAVNGILVSGNGMFSGRSCVFYDKNLMPAENDTSPEFAMTTAEMQTEKFAWMLNTCNGKLPNLGLWSQSGKNYPVFADESNHAIYKVTFLDSSKVLSVYTYKIDSSFTNYKGNIITMAEEPDPTDGDEDLKFGYWGLEDYAVTAKSIINADDSLYAMYIPKNSSAGTLSFVDESGNVITSYVVSDNTVTVTLPEAPAKEGHVFVGWYNGSQQVGVAGDKVAPGTITVLTAKYKPIMYKVSFVSGMKTLQSDSVAYGEMPEYRGEIPACDLDGYEFGGWIPTVAAVTKDAEYWFSCKPIGFSSSSAESSSSEAKSSSSEKSSSSSAKSSSSEQSYSSSAEQESSSSEEHTTVVMATPQKTFNLAVNGMTIALSNTQGGNVRIFDALGHLVVSKPLSATGMTAITMQTSGSYIIRVNGMSQKVLLK
ncbi:InlB B-repeat-containing protein [Fibrobacter sp.]|uniref:InlB B-repeat-containing protein n=3 Tax=Fibrobacter TaxID=832 RepID=UPI0025BCC3BE|nr:InlB B-repeat-containing protein [Fibrobacter sp.]MBS7271392.1 InlB B-repeat-containing protein [Fibrobacter sp.]MCI6436483.1 InlB B-repeat-containing protein [Fibrobacter sp.]MDD7496682.1 InlB B-repeat-containing protein [Fibrobacter sp.]MDY5723182.1 InlB B-repeat-containing protein [Fibrobacter sp.]